MRLFQFIFKYLSFPQQVQFNINYMNNQSQNKFQFIAQKKIFLSGIQDLGIKFKRGQVCRTSIEASYKVEPSANIEKYIM